jgi:hypothetical protein
MAHHLTTLHFPVLPVRLSSVFLMRCRYDIDMTKCIYCGELS